MKAYRNDLNSFYLLKKNINLTEGWVANDLHEANMGPKHLPMRMRARNKFDKYDYEYPDGSYTRQGRMWRYIPRLLEKNVGKSFDKVFSKFCNEYPEFIGSMNTREAFKKHFVEYNANQWFTWYKVRYCIDDAGRIQKLDKPHRFKHQKSHEFFTGTPEYYYVLNQSFLKQHPTFDACFYNIVGAKIYDFCKTEEKIPVRFAEKVKSLISGGVNEMKLEKALIEDGGERRYYEVYDCFHRLFTQKTDTPSFTLDKHDDAYIQHREEEKDKVKRQAREREREKREEYDALMRQLWEIQEKEKQQDIIDRDRLGFDKMSFKREKEE